MGQAACEAMLRSGSVWDGIDERERLDLHVALPALPLVILSIPEQKGQRTGGIVPSGVGLAFALARVLPG